MYEMYAWFGFFGSIAIPVTNRPGVCGVSMRRNCTAPGVSFALDVTNRRPVRVAAHSVPASDGARSTATTYLPARSAPKRVDVRSAPIGTQSPHGSAAERVEVGRQAPVGDQVGLLAAVVVGAPDVLHAGEQAPRRGRVDLERRVERAALRAQLQRVVRRQPRRRIVAVEVDLRRRVVVVVVPDRAAALVESGLAAVAADRLEPAVGLRARGVERPGPVVLGAAEDLRRRRGRVLSTADWNWIVRSPSFIGFTEAGHVCRAAASGRRPGRRARADPRSRRRRSPTCAARTTPTGPGWCACRCGRCRRHRR